MHPQPVRPAGLIVPRVYRTFLHHGFRPGYFPIQIKAWVDAVETILDKPCIKPIVEVYRWLLDHHDTMARLAEVEPEEDIPMDLLTLSQFRERFTNGLINNSFPECLKLAGPMLNEMPINACYRFLIHPSLHQLVQLREQDSISMEQELNASPMAGRVLAHLYRSPVQKGPQPAKGRILFFQTSSTHPEMASWKLADTLRHQGWDVRETSVHSSSGTDLASISDIQPDLIVFSCTMPVKLERIFDITQHVKTDTRPSPLRILLDGPAFFRDPSFLEQSGADAATMDADEACAIIDRWFV